MPDTRNILTLVLLGAAFALLPFLQRPAVASEIVILGLAACAANMLIGYAGLLSFGQAMFFGSGAYVTGILVTKMGAPLAAALSAAALFTAILSYVIGLLCVRRMGLYFLMLTFAFNQMLYFVAASFPSLTGGEDGLPGVIRPASLANPMAFYAFVAMVCLLSLGILRRIVDSPTGRIWRAIRDNPARASAVGHDIARYRLASFTISGFFTGLAGALYAYLFEFVPIDKIHWSFSGDIIFMAIAGGTEYFMGPLLGAALFTWLQDSLSIYWKHWPLAVGIVLVLVIRCAQGGLAGILSASVSWLRRRVPNRTAPMRPSP